MSGTSLSFSCGESLIGSCLVARNPPDAITSLPEAWLRFLSDIRHARTPGHEEAVSTPDS